MPKITIEKHRNKLRLRWRYQNKRYTLSTYREANAIGHAYAKQLKSQVELDMEAGYFDDSLLKYKPRILGPKPTEISAPELFSNWTTHISKEKELSPRSVECRYKPLERSLERSLNIRADTVTRAKAKNFAALCAERLSPGTAKARLWLLQSCWDWAKEKYHLVDENPWRGLANSIKSSHTTKPTKPFSPEEIRAIQAGFRSSKHYQYYADMVDFMFGTACRPGEVFGLRWNSVADDFTHVVIREAVSRGKCFKQTKTKRSRVVYLSESMTQMLRSRHLAMKPQKHALVFPSPTGKPISDHTFRRRAWTKVLASVDVSYRPIYCIRHSVISHSLSSGTAPSDLAKQTGHSTQTLLSYYDHLVRHESIFVEF